MIHCALIPPVPMQGLKHFSNLNIKREEKLLSWEKWENWRVQLKSIKRQVMRLLNLSKILLLELVSYVNIHLKQQLKQVTLKKKLLFQVYVYGRDQFQQQNLEKI